MKQQRMDGRDTRSNYRRALCILTRRKPDLCRCLSLFLWRKSSMKKKKRNRKRSRSFWLLSPLLCIPVFLSTFFFVYFLCLLHYTRRFLLLYRWCGRRSKTSFHSPLRRIIASATTAITPFSRAQRSGAICGTCWADSDFRGIALVRASWLSHRFVLGSLVNVRRFGV